MTPLKCIQAPQSAPVCRPSHQASCQPFRNPTCPPPLFCHPRPAARGMGARQGKTQDNLFDGGGAFRLHKAWHAKKPASCWHLRLRKQQLERVEFIQHALSETLRYNTKQLALHTARSQSIVDITACHAAMRLRLSSAVSPLLKFLSESWCKTLKMHSSKPDMAVWLLTSGLVCAGAAAIETAMDWRP